MVKNTASPNDWSDSISALVENALGLFSVRNLQQVKHNSTAPIVPLSAAATFVSKLEGDYPAFRLKFGLGNWPLLSSLNAIQETNDGYYCTLPPETPAQKEFEGGFNITRIVVAGLFADDKYYNKMSDRKPHG